MGGPATLDAKALDAAVSAPEPHLVSRTLRDLHQHANGGIAQTVGWNGVHQRHIDGVEDAQPVQIALGLIERILLEEVAWPQ